MRVNTSGNLPSLSLLSSTATSSSSNNKRNHGHYIMTWDKPVIMVLGVLLCLYCGLTLVTYHKVAHSEMWNKSLQQRHVAASERQLQDQAFDAAVKEVISVHKIVEASTAAAAAAAAGHPSSLPGITKEQGGTPEAIRALQHTFPIHVGTDRVVIPHPGFQTMAQEQGAEHAASSWPKDLPTNMTVPQFFEESHGWVYGGSIRNYLGRGEQLMTPALAAQIGSKIVANNPNDGGGEVETIYCSIASYRDPECSGSVIDLYERAKYPERIRVAIIDQRVEGDMKCGLPEVPCSQDPTQTLCKYGHLIDRTEIHARHACGPVFARHLAHRHYRGEYFAMQLDSHVRFVEHWDEDLVNFWYSARNEMAVLTTYLSDINDSIDPITHTSTHPTRPIMCASDYEGNGEYRHLRHGQQPEGVPYIHGQPTLHPFWAAGFSFARGHFVIQVPYDQYLPMVFQGEEISIGLRGFTYGYDYYTPERGVLFHMYAIKANEAKRKQVPLFWENQRIYAGVGMRAMRRLNTIIGMEHYPKSQWLTDEEWTYGLGKVRNVQTFFDVFGIHVEEHRVEAHLCRFVGRPMMNAFLPALRPNRMGLDYDKISFRFVDPEQQHDPNFNNNNQKFVATPTPQQVKELQRALRQQRLERAVEHAQTEQEKAAKAKEDAEIAAARAAAGETV